MEEQEMLRNSYHKYMEMARNLPGEMENCGVFEQSVTMMTGHQRCLQLTFSHEGTVKINKRKKPIPITSIEKLLYTCFPEREFGCGMGYKIEPKNLQEVAPLHVCLLRIALEKAEKSLEEFAYYRGENILK
jgi:hypothetical protein